MKIRRNDPCPCGSGKKYKKCCLLSEQSKEDFGSANRAFFQSSGLDAPKIKAFLEKHNCTSILDYLIALQMNPQNHGKNLRIEHLAQLTVSSLGKGNITPNLSVFHQLIDEEYPLDEMEDIPINMFSETVVFHGGNYPFFPGMSTHVVELFRAMTEAIYYRNDIFKAEFQKEIYKEVSFLLELGDLIAYRAGIKGLIRGNENRREKISKPKVCHSYSITETMMNEFLTHYSLDGKMIDSFVLDKDNPMILTEQAERNPLLYRPIIKYDDCFHFIGISNQGCAINNFILKTAEKFNCIPELVQQTQYGIWMKIGASCVEYMHWGQSGYNDLFQNDELFNEELFQIDVNWLAYVCYVKDVANEVSIDGNDKYVRRDIGSRLSTTLSRIKNDDRTKDCHILTLVLYLSMGESFAVETPKQPNTDYLLMISAFDFLQLIQTEKWDSMSLVRFARTKETKPYIGTPFNQLIDIYSLYKQHGESFYISDKAAPNIVHLEPNDGCHLIFESKEQLNFHGTPLSYDDRFAYIPVQRDMEYANIYKPIHSSVIAKSCESYSIPVWARCNQKIRAGLYPSSIIDPIITAIVFWMDRLKPSIDGLINSEFKNPIEVELLFSEDVLEDDEIWENHNITKTARNLVVKKTNSGVSVFMDQGFILSFMGPTNGSEREMMLRIIIELLNLTESEAKIIIDKHIPYGSAKMILMTDTSNNPLISPQWLYTPIYIHSATSQKMLDDFPKWMVEKGHVIDELNEKQSKVDFLHAGVDVLLDKLSEKVKEFDVEFLLKMLVNNHETLLYRREHNKVLQPAQILCFGDSENKRKEFLEDETKLTESGLATRAMIEYLSATQDLTGRLRPGNDDIEGILSIMSEVVRIGGICDAIYLDVANHTIETLASGRYGIYDDDFNDNLGNFANARSVEEVNHQIEDFNDKMKRLARQETKAQVEKNKELIAIDEAFNADWGITYTNILQFLYACHLLAVKRKASAIEISENDLLSEVIKIYPDLSKEIVRKCLNRLSLDKRPDYLTPPEGMTGRDIFPWIYNRELSYLRRPIVRYTNPDGEKSCLFGFRSCIAAGLQLADLLYSGRLRNGGKKIEKILGYYLVKKGKAFNEVVRGFLKQIPNLKVWDFDVVIKPSGNLKAKSDYGDIDVLAYDSSRNIVYSIECKNTNTAKNVKEMKTEMDEYLGKGENLDKDRKSALVLKHLRRHQWILDNMEQFKSFIGIEVTPVIKSMMLTATVIPTSYLKKKTSPLSILNYPELKLNGLEYLDSSKEPDVSVLL